MSIPIIVFHNMNPSLYGNLILPVSTPSWNLYQFFQNYFSLCDIDVFSLIPPKFPIFNRGTVLCRLNVNLLVLFFLCYKLFNICVWTVNLMQVQLLVLTSTFLNKLSTRNIFAFKIFPLFFVLCWLSLIFKLSLVDLQLLY